MQKRQHRVDEDTIVRLRCLWLWCHYWPEVRASTWAKGVKRLVPRAGPADAFVHFAPRVCAFVFAPVEWLN